MHLEAGTVVRQKNQHRSVEMTTGQKIVEMVPEVIVCPPQKVIVVMRVLDIEEERELERCWSWICFE